MTTSPARKELPPAYEPSVVEGKIYEMWEQGGYFRAPIVEGQQPYSIVMPPPNVTGELHLGHGLEDAITDALVRWHRMQGDPTLWLPGEDHAGIATQNVLEREIAREGLTRHDMGREAFVARVWMWVRKYRSRIQEQHARLGASADWSRNTFTLDPKIVLAVRTTFVNLYNDGLIYRGLRMINWCPRCETALSDLEVDYEEEAAKLYHVRYPVVGEGGMPLPHAVIVATTRPETMVADTGVAVNPDDPRYENRVGRMLLLPLVGREIPVVADEHVKPEFGTGAVKVTPGHDPNDWDIGQRHDLPVIVAMDRDGLMNDEAGPYAGMTMADARDRILKDLEDEGFLVKVEDYTHSVGHCSRCRTVVEPVPSEQWWIAVNKEYEPGRSMASEAAAVVRDGRINIVPSRFTGQYLNWLENLRDWCISRQLWWGHQIPAWYCANNHITVAIDDPASCDTCGDTALRQDEDVLDTWFSSGLAPHADLGWPEDTEDLRYFYPTSDMQMGYDIMFFWCARMVLFACYNMRHLGPEQQVPFKNVLFHGLIRDVNGQKMTKSRGNVVDPLTVVSRFGADAFRFAILAGAAMGADQRYSDERLAAARNFANKLWNTARFVLMKVGDRRIKRPHAADQHTYALEDRWIMSRLEAVEGEANALLGRYELGAAVTAVEEFLWNDFCDWYIEFAKVRLNAGDDRPLRVLVHVLDHGLRLLHPFMPFVTEELWQTLRDHIDDDMASALIVAWFPKPAAIWRDEAAETAMAHVIEVNRAIRNIRAEKKLEVSFRPKTYLRSADFASALAEVAAATAFTSRVEPEVLPSGAELPAGDYAFARVADTEVAVSLPKVDAAEERARLEKELAETAAYVDRLTAQLANENFRSRAPANVIQGVESNLAEATLKANGLRERIAVL
ncbi:MAG: valine--tRNA ligase [Dehalococcoidia bacterium]|nr:valine--tRNA ligase [Dehalococcoidia bacterium]MCB9486239.1 valine--tRNA ligase [Thermoflexaceae bacterium]